MERDYEAAIRIAVTKAIEAMGIDGLRKTSLLMSNWRRGVK